MPTKECHPDKLIACEDYYETRYIFTLDVSNMVSIDEDAGIFYLLYECNPKLRKSDGYGEKIIEFQMEVGWYKCPVCERKEKHVMYIFDTVKFLRKNKSLAKNHKSVTNAERDKEWLILPRDYSPELNGYSSFIPRADIWNVEHYYLEYEGKRDPTLYTTQGIIIE